MSALWKPTDKLTVVIRHDLTHEGGTGYTGTNFAPALQAGLLPGEVPDPRAVIWRGPQPAQDMLHYGASGTLTAPFPGIHGWYWENTGDKEITAYCRGAAT